MFFFCQTVNPSYTPNPTHLCTDTHIVLLWQQLPILYTHTDTPSHMKVARCSAKSCLRMSMSFYPPKQNSRWPTVKLNLCRNQSKTEQCFICSHWAVAAHKIHAEHTFILPSCPGVHSHSIIQYLSHYVWVGAMSFKTPVWWAQQKC